MRFLKSFGLVLLLGLLRVPPAAAQFPPAPGTGPGLPETIEAIDSARVTTRILYITAHPDDESAAVLTYLARGLHADVALLTLTHGEGGQNALGPEQGPQLGLIRTQELLAATRGYGVKLYFTRARDLGYSKTIEETQKIWGDQVLEDMVSVIRSFRPNIVINGWGGVHSGHGHHQLSGIWTPKAVVLAADPSYRPKPPCDYCGDVGAWGGPFDRVRILDFDRDSKDHGLLLPLDEVSPLWGKTWREIGIDAFANHRTQGISVFLGSPLIRRPVALVPEDGAPFDPATLAEPLNVLHGSGQSDAGGKVPGVWSRVKEIDDELAAARTQALSLHWAEATAAVAQAGQILNTIIQQEAGPNQRDLVETRNKIWRALQLVAGVQVDAAANRVDIAHGEDVQVAITHRCRNTVDCKFEDVELETYWGIQSNTHSRDETQNDVVTLRTVKLPPADSSSKEGHADSTPPIWFGQRLNIDGYQFVAEVEATYLSASSTRIERVPLRFVPPYTLAVEPAQAIDILSAEHKPFDVFLRVHSYSTKAAKITVGLNVPDGITASTPVELAFDGIGDQYAKFAVTPPAKLDPGDFTISAYAKRGDETFSTSLEPLPSMPTILWSEPAQCVVHAFDINVPPHLRVGYISAEGEPIPEALKRLGISVEMLDPAALAFGDFPQYDAIVVGVRAYELRPELAGANKRLLDYVSAGGTLVVQYNRDFVWDKLQPAPYPAKIGNPNPRVTDETAEVKFPQPADPLLNSPNKITAADFNNWVQERGLYYWSVFDSRYTPLLAMHDPGETDLNGGLVYTHYGQGTYIYTGLSFFRQLPEGNSGAYRLFVNLISASRARQASATH